MKKNLLALVALLSFYQAFVKPALAQEPAEPPTTATEIIGDTGDKSLITTPLEDLRNATHTDVCTVDRGTRVYRVMARGVKISIEGVVRDDVIVSNCDLTIADGAAIGGTIIAYNSKLHLHQSGLKVRNLDDLNFGKQYPELARHKQFFLTSTTGREPWERLVFGQPATQQARPEMSRMSWRGAQWGLFLFGLVSTFVLTLIAPKATKQATDTAVFEPGRSLVVGLIAGVIAVMLLLANAVAVHSPVGLLYAPFGAVVALIPMAVLVAGWLCGMRVIGDWAAQRMGKPMEGHLFSRIAGGLFLFLLLKVVVGGTMLGSAALFFEGMIALLGTGALLITGFGSRPDWLGSRLRGESRWFGGNGSRF